MKSNFTILIAEDDPGNFILTKRIIRRAGIPNNIIQLFDGQETLKFLQEAARNNESILDKIYLLLLDIRMPKIDGITVLEQMKKQPHLATIPVIMLSASNSLQNKKRCAELGCPYYFVKPPGPELIDAIEKYTLGDTESPHKTAPQALTSSMVSSPREKFFSSF